MRTQTLRDLANKWRKQEKEMFAYVDNEDGRMEELRDRAERSAMLGCANDLDTLLDVLGDDE